MPHVVLTIEDLPPAALLQTAGYAAGELGFTVEGRVADGELRVRKGDLWSAVLFGAFALYCDFRVFVGRGRRGEPELWIEWTNTFWGGFIGAERTASAAAAYADAIEDLIEEAGGRVEDRRRS